MYVEVTEWNLLESFQNGMTKLAFCPLPLPLPAWSEDAIPGGDHERESPT